MQGGDGRHGSGGVQERAGAEEGGADDGPGVGVGVREAGDEGGEGDEAEREAPGGDGGGGGVLDRLAEPRGHVAGAVGVRNDLKRSDGDEVERGADEASERCGDVRARH